MSPSVTPHIWFNDQAEAAMTYYCEVFSDAQIVAIERYPDESLDQHFAGMAGKVIQGIFTLNGQELRCIDGGPMFPLTEAFSLVVSCADQEEIDYYWSKLSHVPANEQCGWCKDQFGLSWQIIPADMGSLLTNPAQIQAMMAMKKIDIAALQALAG